DFTR
ncbi:hypothetical protein D044_2666B, partial [Vibrio parahaemolyticus EKP-026]